MNYYNKSHQELLDVQFETRMRLCKILAFIGTTFLSVFSIISFKNQHLVLAVVLLVCMFFGLVSLYLLYRTAHGKLAVHIINGILFVLSLTLLFTGGHENTGMLWIYPTIAINLFINRFRPAVFLSGSFIISSSLLLFTPLSDWLITSYSFSTSIRFEVTLFVLCLICLAALHSKERADEMIIQMHDDDIRKLAYYDSLTGLPNRWNFTTNLARLLQRADIDQQQVGLLYIDLDNFKQVNDNYGHQVGDKLLCAVSERLKEAIRPTDVIINAQSGEIARLGGDEFVVILNGLTSSINASIVAERILGVFEGGLEIAETTHPVFASIGIAVFPDDATTPDDLLHHADLAMYEAKRNGRNRYEFYTKAIAETLRERRRIEDGLRQALERNLLSLVFMPLFNCHTLEIVGIEVLLRCQNLAIEGIGPDRFIPVAEKTNLIKEIDLWVIDNSMVRLIELQSSYGYRGKLLINISGVELQDELFPLKIKELLERHQVAPSSIEFEITETAFVLDDDKGIAMLEQLRDLGISLALDDFGTGYTAFSQLINYPVNCLKIDRSFVGDLFSEHEARKNMVHIIRNLAELYELRVVAEGVETQEQLEYLRDIDCDWVQGYFLSHPLKWNDLVNQIDQNNHELRNWQAASNLAT